MHPSEMKNCALVAAARAERDGFTATAEALKLLASACALEARELENQPEASTGNDRTGSTLGRVVCLEVGH
jgi:hypothetical protein